MKKIYTLSKTLLLTATLLFSMTVSAQESLTITVGDIELDPNQDTVLTAEYISGTDTTTEGIKWNTEPGYLGKVDENGILTTSQPGSGYLIAKYKELRDSVNLVVAGTPKNDDDDEGDEDDYPKVKIVPGKIKVEVGDSVEIYAFYVNSLDEKIDTTFIWSVDPMDIGEFPDSTKSMFQAGDETGSGTVVAKLGDLADTVKIEVYQSKWKKQKKEKQNKGNSGKQLTIMPGDTAVYNGSAEISYSAIYKTNGKKHQDLDFNWTVSDTTIATIGETDGILTLTGETGMTLVNVEYSNFCASVELLVLDSTVDLDVNTISIHRVLPDGKALKAKTFKEGDSYKIGGLPYPLNILNGGMLHFPFGCINEDIEIYMFIPEEYAGMNDDSTEVVYTEDIITGVKFSVKPVDSTDIVEPYWFNIPVELKLIYKKELLDSLGIDPQNLDVFFADSSYFEEVGDGVATVDTARNRIYSSIVHFSTIVVKEKKAATTVEELSPVSKDVLNIYPNPFSSSATVQFTLAERGEVNLTVYNIFGQKIQVLAYGEYKPGIHKVTWTGNDLNGAPATSGIYLCRFMKDGELGEVKRIILNR